MATEVTHDLKVDYLEATGVTSKKIVVNVTDALTLTAADSGKLFVFNDVDGAVITLPDSGAGDIIGTTYSFLLGVTATSNAHKVICADTDNEIIHGIAINSDTDTGDAAVNFAAIAGDGFDFVSCNGSTTGIQGSHWTLTNFAADKWLISNSQFLSTGDPATPFGST